MSSRARHVRYARAAAVLAVVLGAVAMAELSRDRGPLLLCSLLPPACIVGALSGPQYLTGDSPAALTFVTIRWVIAPLVALYASFRSATADAAGTLLAAVAALVSLGPPTFGTYGVLPFDHMIGATLAAVAGLLAGSAVRGQEKSPESRSPTERR